jgi:hypothetical protein
VLYWEELGQRAAEEGDEVLVCHCGGNLIGELACTISVDLIGDQLYHHANAIRLLGVVWHHKRELSIFRVVVVLGVQRVRSF